MENLFVADYFKNETTTENAKDIELVKRWLKQGEAVLCRMRELSSYFEVEADFEVEAIIEQNGVTYVKSIGMLFPFAGFSENVHILRHWRIFKLSDGKTEGRPIKDLELAKQLLEEGAMLICTYSGDKTDCITVFETMCGIDYVTTGSGHIYILEPERLAYHFNRIGVLKWPSELD